MDRYKITFETWNKVASDYQDKFMDLDLYNDTYDLFCEQVTKNNARVLEIGCGPGNITRYLLTKRSDFKIEGLDVAPNMIQLAHKNNPTAQFRVMDCREINTLTPGWDGIMCGFCMPYLSKEDCAKLIRDCSSLLNPGGILYISTIEGDYQNSGYETASTGDSAYVYYHEAGYLTDMLTGQHFEEIKVIRKEYPGAKKNQSTHLIIIAKKSVEQ